MLEKMQYADQFKRAGRQMTVKKRKKQTKYNSRRGLLTVSAVCALIAALLLIIDLYNYWNHTISFYASEQEILAASMMQAADTMMQEENKVTDDYTDLLIRHIERGYPTNGSNFCFVAEDSRLVFLKDRDTKVMYETTSAYLSQDGRSPLPLKEPAQISYRVWLAGGEPYLVTMRNVQYGEHIYTLGICTRQGYLVKKSWVDALSLHLVFYVGALLLILMTIAFFLHRELRERQERLDQVLAERKEDRRSLEQLEETVKNLREGTSSVHNSGMYSRDMVEMVLNLMSEEQARCSIQLAIRTDLEVMETHVVMTAVLERLLKNKGIGCLWKEQTYMAVLFHTTEEEGRDFVEQMKNLLFRELELSTADWKFYIGYPGGNLHEL